MGLFAGCPAREWETRLRSTPARSLSEGCFKGEEQRGWINHRLVTFLNHGFGSQDVSGLQFLARWSMAQGSVSSSCLGETA